MRVPLVAGNWKMHGTIRESVELARAVRAAVEGVEGVEVAVFPPYPALERVGEALKGSSVRLGAQDMHWEAKGAFTGEVSPAMLKDVGCGMAILGHSERRHIIGEGNDLVNRKVRAAVDGSVTCSRPWVRVHSTQVSVVPKHTSPASARRCRSG